MVSIPSPPDANTIVSPVLGTAPAAGTGETLYAFLYTHRDSGQTWIGKVKTRGVSRLFPGYSFARLYPDAAVVHADISSATAAALALLAKLRGTDPA